MLCLEDSAIFWETPFEICRLCQVPASLSLLSLESLCSAGGRYVGCLVQASCVPGTSAIPSSQHLPNEEQSQALG